MMDAVPDREELTALLGETLYGVWSELCAVIDGKYDMEHLWGRGGRAWKYEYKYRRGGKTLCALYAREGCMGFMVVLGRDERLRFEAGREEYSAEVRDIYDTARTYHDGKWLMFEPADGSLFGDFIRLLEIKRRPNRRPAV